MGANFARLIFSSLCIETTFKFNRPAWIHRHTLAGRDIVPPRARALPKPCGSATESPKACFTRWSFLRPGRLAPPNGGPFGR